MSRQNEYAEENNTITTESKNKHRDRVTTNDCMLQQRLAIKI